MCLWSSSCTCMKRSALCFGTFPFDSHFEIHLQKGLSFAFVVVLPIYLLTKNFGVVFPVSVTTGAVASVCGVKSLDECCQDFLLLVLKADPS